MIISLIGMPGCGKTSVGKAVAKKLDMKFVDVDQYIEEHYGSIKSLFEISEAHFRECESNALADCLENDNIILSTGGGIIINENNRIALSSKTSVIFINRDIEQIIQSTDFNDRPLLKKDHQKIYKLYKNRIELYKKTAHLEIISNNIFDDTVGKVIDFIKKSSCM